MPYSFQILVVGCFCLVSSSISFAQQAQLRTAIVSQDGDPISSVQVGDTFFLDLLATDLRPNGMGVFASYADINYDSGKVLADGIVLLDSQNSGLDANTFLDGMIDEAGSFGGVTATGPGERRLVRFPFHATSVGQAVFQLEPADQSPVHDTVFYNSLGSVPLDQIEFQGSAVTVVPEPTTWSITSAALLLAVVVRAFGGVLDAQRRRLIHS